MPREDSQRTLLAIAWSIAELDTALAHLSALERVGEQVSFTITGRVQREINEWTWMWVQRKGPDFTPVDQAEVVAAARAYLTEHQRELDELLNPE